MMKLSNKRVPERQISNAGRHCWKMGCPLAPHSEPISEHLFQTSLTISFDLSPKRMWLFHPPVSSSSTQLLATKDASNLGVASGPPLETSPTGLPCCHAKDEIFGTPSKHVSSSSCCHVVSRTLLTTLAPKVQVLEKPSQNQKGGGERERINPLPSTFFAWAPHPASGVRMSHHQPRRS